MAISAVSLDGLSLTSAPYGLLSIAGWGSPAGTLAPVLKPRQSGAWGGWSYLKPRSVVLTGDAVATDDADGVALADALIGAASLEERVLSVTEGDLTRSVPVRRDGDVLIDWRPGSTRIFSWSVQLVALDPRKRGSALTGSTSLPSSSGGLTVPVTVPFTISATTVTGQVALANPGNTAGPVHLRIDGPVTAPIVTHVSSGRALIFSSSLVLGAGQWIDVDMDRREVLENGQASRNGWVTGRGWSAFDPGDNVWAFAAGVFDPGSLLTVTATPAWE